MEKLLIDIFSMRFDIIIPLSSCLIALALAAVLFSIRFISYNKNKRKHEKRMRQDAGFAPAGSLLSITDAGGEGPLSVKTELQNSEMSKD